MEKTLLRKKLEILIRVVFFESWMDEEDYQEYISELFSETNFSYEQMEKDILTGIENGYSEEFQLNLLHLMLSSAK